MGQRTVSKNNPLKIDKKRVSTIGIIVLLGSSILMMSLFPLFLKLSYDGYIEIEEVNSKIILDGNWFEVSMEILRGKVKLERIELFTPNQDTSFHISFEDSIFHKGEHFHWYFENKEQYNITDTIVFRFVMFQNEQWITYTLA